MATMHAAQVASSLIGPFARFLIAGGLILVGGRLVVA